MSISSLCRSGTPTGSSPALPAASPPRLLFVASTKSQGGIERHSVALAAALSRRGVPVRYACAPGGFIEEWCRHEAVPTDRFTLKNSGDLGAALRLAGIIQARRIDIVHVHSRRDYVTAVLGVTLARRIFRQPAALVLHAHMVRTLGGPSRLSARFFERGAGAVVAVSQTVYAHLRRDYFARPAFVRLIPNGIDLSRFAPLGSQEAAQSRTQMRRSLGLPADAPVLGMIGRLDAKGQRALLAVTARLRAIRPDLHIVLTGSEGKPGERAALHAQAAAGGFADDLIFTGPRTDIPALLTVFDVLVHLPTDEAFGLALAEAMAAGLPTVATAIGGCREVVRDGKTGFLVPPRNSDALLDALLCLLDPALGESRRAEMGAAGYEVVQENFSQERQIERLQALYRELCPASV